MKPCSICAELRVEPHNLLHETLGSDVRNAILAVTPSYALIPSIGPLTFGHSLIVSRTHSCNVLATASGQQHDELRQLPRTLLGRLADCGNTDMKLFCFEHGSLDESADQPLCSTIHGHIHLVPLQSGLAESLLEDALALGGYYQLVSLLDYVKLTKQTSRFVSVFLADLTSNDWHFHVRSAETLPSQHMRMLIAERLGVSNWNWKEDSRRPILERSIARLGFDTNRLAICNQPNHSEGFTISISSDIQARA